MNFFAHTSIHILSIVHALYYIILYFIFQYAFSILCFSSLVLGSIPVLSYTDTVEGQVNVTCMSDGWSPQPTLSWRDRHGEEIRDVPETAYSTGESFSQIDPFTSLQEK